MEIFIFKFLNYKIRWKSKALPIIESLGLFTRSEARVWLAQGATIGECSYLYVVSRVEILIKKI